MTKKMKKVASLLFSLLFMFMISGNTTAQSNWYEIEYSMSYTSGGIFIVTTCTSIPGSACNMPGSIHRSDIGPILAMIG
jgi:hypothetical protein